MKLTNYAGKIVSLAHKYIALGDHAAAVVLLQEQAAKKAKEAHELRVAAYAKGGNFRSQRMLAAYARNDAHELGLLANRFSTIYKI